MEAPLPPHLFRPVCETALRAELGAGGPRAELHAALLEDVTALLVPMPGGGPTAAAVLAALPRAVARRMEPVGWRWNGFYVLGEDGDLHLGPAHGPPVCALLQRARDERGRPLAALSSGMCFDALLLNQTLLAPSVAAWPGYVSCDAASGLATVAGLVAPLRDPEGRPIAVWDLDASEEVTPADARVADALFSALSRVLRLDAGAFGLPGRPAGP